MKNYWLHRWANRYRTSEACSRKLFNREKLIRSLAQQQAVKPGVVLGGEEMTALVQDLFACSQPATNANGSPTYIDFKKEYLDGLFKK